MTSKPKEHVEVLQLTFQSKDYGCLVTARDFYEKAIKKYQAEQNKKIKEGKLSKDEYVWIQVMRLPK